jgi:hypothetical protein
VRAVLINPADWPAYAERLAPALARMADGSGGRYTAADIAAEIEAGRVQCWIATDGAAIGCVLVTAFAHYPRLTALRLVGIVGSAPRAWLHLWDVVDAWARAQGCERTEALAPRSYDRVLRRHGFSEFHVLSERTL